MYLIKTGKDEITDIEDAVCLYRRDPDYGFIERSTSEAEDKNVLFSIAGETQVETDRIWEHLLSLCKFDATLSAPTPAPNVSTSTFKFKQGVFITVVKAHEYRPHEQKYVGKRGCIWQTVEGFNNMYVVEFSQDEYNDAYLFQEWQLSDDTEIPDEIEDDAIPF